MLRAAVDFSFICGGTVDTIRTLNLGQINMHDFFIEVKTVCNKRFVIYFEKYRNR